MFRKLTPDMMENFRPDLMEPETVLVTQMLWGQTTHIGQLIVCHMSIILVSACQFVSSACSADALGSDNTYRSVNSLSKCLSY